MPCRRAVGSTSSSMPRTRIEYGGCSVRKRSRRAEAAQEGFILLSGECLAIVEGQERRMRQWDYLHSPPGTAHVIVGAGDGPCALVMFGSPDPRRKVEWIADETAAKHGASVERTTGRDTEAYGDLPAEVRTPPPAPFGR